MNSLKLILSVFFFLLAILFLVAIFVIDSNFSNITIEQIIFHIWLIDKIFIVGDPQNIIQSSIIFLLLLLAVSYYFLWRRNSSGQRLVISFLFFFFSLFLFNYKYHLLDYIDKKFSKSDLYQKHYVNSHDTGITFFKKKNLVLIYWESMENIYKNVEVFGDNLLKETSRLQESEKMLGSYQQIEGAGWTMASHQVVAFLLLQGRQMDT